MLNSSKIQYRMPAEWERHSAVWLAWPYDKISFGSLNQKDNKINIERLTKVEKTFLKIISLLRKSEQVKLITKDKTDYADVWTRDYIPTFVKDCKNNLIAIKWIYDAYGEKFKGLIKDNNVWSEVNKKLKIKTVETGVVMESGAFEVNGGGTLLTTKQCMSARNPSLSRIDIENIFAKYLGIKKIIWLKKGLINDHTDGHIDEITKFVAPNKIVCAYEENTKDENFKNLNDNYQILKNSTDQNGKKFEIIKLPMPHMKYDDGSKAPVSYANFYIGNTVVLVPVYDDLSDAKALEIIQLCFPERKVVGIDCREIIYGGGAIHCMTQQQPGV